MNNKPMSKVSLYRDCFIISLLMGICVILISLYLAYSIYTSQEKNREYSYENCATLIDNEISGSFDYINNYMQFLGEHIILQEKPDLNLIESAFRNFASHKSGEENPFSLIKFNWISPNQEVLIDSVHGKLNDQDLTLDKKYLTFAKKHPWQFSLFPPELDPIGNQKSIPAVMGIADNTGKHYGTIVVSFNYNKLVTRLSSMLPKSMAFIIVDNAAREILVNSVHIKNSSKIHETIKQIQHTIFKNHKNSAKLNKIFSEENGLNLVYYKKSTQYPFWIIFGKNKSYVTAELYKILLPRIIELALIWVFFSALIYYLRYKVISPIRNLATAASKIAKQEQTEVVPSNYLELDKLAQQLRSIQVLEKNLIVAKQEAEHANNQLLEVNQDLQQKTIALEEALKAKTAFLNSVSHEVRTPVQGVTALSQGLIEHWNDFTEEKRIELATKVAKNANRLFSLVNNILDLSKFIAGKMVLNKYPANIVLLIEEMIEECKELYIGNKNIDILFKHEGNYSQSIFDKERISQVLRNLVVNAIKFTSQGNITIELIKTTIEIDNKQTEAFSVSIADEGMGIPESELETIFDNFRQSSRSINISGGTGLGLSISREIIKAHNGKIWAENLPTRGAKFTFILPIQPPNTLPEGNYNIPITILMLDDEETCLASMAVLLYNTPYTLIQFTSGQAGLDYLAQYPGTVDLIFLDLMMPDMYGLDFISRLKQQEGLKYIPVILQSGISDDDEITKALEMGVEGFIRKPYQKEQILNSIYQILAKRL